MVKIHTRHRFGKGGITCWHWVANSKGKQETFLFYLKRRVAPSQRAVDIIYPDSGIYNNHFAVRSSSRLPSHCNFPRYFLASLCLFCNAKSRKASSTSWRWVFDSMVLAINTFHGGCFFLLCYLVWLAIQKQV